MLGLRKKFSRLKNLSGKKVKVQKDNHQVTSTKRLKRNVSGVMSGISTLSMRPRTVPFTKWSRKIYGSEKAVENEHLKVMEAGTFIIHPFSNFRLGWDIISAVLIVFNIVLIPLDIAFSGDKHSLSGTIFKLLCDIWFLVDVVLNFRTGIHAIEGDHAEIIFDLKTIQRRYLSTWFIVDVVASFPIDYVVLTLYGSHGRSAQVVRLLRIGKVLSLMRIGRVPRLIRSLHQWEEVFNLQYDMAVSFLRFANLIFIIFLVCHWNGCMQYMVPLFYNFPDDTWVKIRGLDHPNITWYEAYSWSLFKSTSHMLCIGFSTVIPRGLIDLWTTMLSQISGAILFAVFISNAINLMEEMDMSKHAYKEKIAHIREYLAFRRLPLSMRRRVFDYFEIRYGGKLFDEQEVLLDLSPSLRRDVIMYNCADLIHSVTLFDDVSDDFVYDIGQKMRFTIFTPGDMLVREGNEAFHMYFIERGVVSVCLKTGEVIRHLNDGMHFGEICMILTNLVRAASVTALSNIHAYVLERKDFQEVAAKYPQEKLRIETRYWNIQDRTSLYDYVSKKSGSGSSLVDTETTMSRYTV